MKWELPQLGYGYDALEPYFDAKTMEIHHSKHHQTYIDKMNAILEKYPDLTETPVELMKKLDSLVMEDADKKAFKNHGGGYINHALFWQMLNPAGERDEKLVAEIIKIFGSMDLFKEKFSQTALGHFGSGWAWLARNEKNELEVYSTSNQDSPLLKNHQPILCLDVWEHAYYLKYQNRRAEFIEAWWQVLKLI
ncbi:MAG: superoxide dismutase [Candidatus Komeilibacteria bacterium]|nr:superoxide dismutase [Candidatus Komeilibacteria bacterium]